MKNWIIKNFGLKGSWKWAKKQMANGKIVRCKHWSGALKHRTSPEICKDLNGNEYKSTLLQSNYTRTNKQLENNQPIWETSNHHLSYEEFTDYEIFEWQLKTIKNPQQ